MLTLLSSLSSLLLAPCRFSRLNEIMGMIEPKALDTELEQMRNSAMHMLKAKMDEERRDVQQRRQAIESHIEASEIAAEMKKLDEEQRIQQEKAAQERKAIEELEAANRRREQREAQQREREIERQKVRSIVDRWCE